MKGAVQRIAGLDRISGVKCLDLPEAARMRCERVTEGFAPAYGSDSTVRLSCARIVPEKPGMNPCPGISGIVQLNSLLRIVRDAALRGSFVGFI